MAFDGEGDEHMTEVVDVAPLGACGAASVSGPPGVAIKRKATYEMGEAPVLIPGPGDGADLGPPVDVQLRRKTTTDTMEVPPLLAVDNYDAEADAGVQIRRRRTVAGDMLVSGTSDGGDTSPPVAKHGYCGGGGSSEGELSSQVLSSRNLSKDHLRNFVTAFVKANMEQRSPSVSLQPSQGPPRVVSPQLLPQTAVSTAPVLLNLAGNGQGGIDLSQAAGTRAKLLGQDSVSELRIQLPSRSGAAPAAARQPFGHVQQQLPQIKLPAAHGYSMGGVAASTSQGGAGGSAAPGVGYGMTITPAMAKAAAAAAAATSGIPRTGSRGSMVSLRRAATVDSSTPSQFSRRTSDLAASRIAVTAIAQTATIEGQMDMLYNSLQSREGVVDIPPPSQLVAELKPYQREALSWMYHREQVQSAPFTVDLPSSQPRYAAPAFGSQQLASTGVGLGGPTAVRLPRGGILADDQGMGKTVEILSVILATMEPASAGGSHRSESPVQAVPQAASMFDLADIPPATAIPSQTTLIVSPLSTVLQWVSEMTRHTVPGALNIYVYHGSSRKRDAQFLAQHDVVVTTYSTLAVEHHASVTSPGGEPPVLEQVHWKRVVLDEAHMIKDRATRGAKAAFALHAERRWCVSGTPVQNKIDDLFSLVQFLQVKPFGTYAMWNAYIGKPIRSGDTRGFAVLQNLLGRILIRRTKDQRVDDAPIIDLPERQVLTRVCDFNDEERDFYQQLWSMSRSCLASFVQAGTVFKHYSVVLELLLRLRQACDHPYLCARSGEESTIPSNPAAAAASVTDAQCCMCLEALDSGGIMTATCNHAFCYPCIASSLEETRDGRPSSCPLCGTALDETQLNALSARPSTAAAVAAAASEAAPQARPWKSSAKTRALMEDIESMLAEDDKGLKCIVFSQWTSMLDLVQIPLEASGIELARLDGKMSRAAREAALTRFRTDPACRVFLISLKAGGLGLNLTEASRVFLLDPWWNPTTEEQAIDRVHRLNQTRDVRVLRYVIRDTIEEHIHKTQDKKKMLADGALAKTTKEIKMEDLKALFTL